MNLLEIWLKKIYQLTDRSRSAKFNVTEFHKMNRFWNDSDFVQGPVDLRFVPNFEFPLVCQWCCLWFFVQIGWLADFEGRLLGMDGKIIQSEDFVAVFVNNAVFLNGDDNQRNQWFAESAKESWTTTTEGSFSGSIWYHQLVLVHCTRVCWLCKRQNF